MVEATATANMIHAHMVSLRACAGTSDYGGARLVCGVTWPVTSAVRTGQADDERTCGLTLIIARPPSPR